MKQSWRTRPNPIEDSQIDLRMEADVLVVGLGYSGTAALRSAAESGVRAIGIEAMLEKGFSTFGRDIGHINSRFLGSRGIPPVDELDFYNEWMARAGNRANPALIRSYVRNSGAAFDWFTDMYGVEGLADVHVAFWPNASQNFDGRIGAHRFWRGTAQFPDPRGWSGHPTLTELVKANHEAARKLGAEIYYGTEALQIVMDGNRPRAVIAKNRHKQLIRIDVTQSVVLAAGDFSGNPEMMADLITDLQDMFTADEGFRRMFGRTGRGIQLGLWAGGRLEPRPIPTMGGNYNTLVGVTGTTGVLWLDPGGKRYCNEAFGDPVFCGFAGSQMSRGTYYHVFDSDVWSCLSYSPPAHGSYDHADEKQSHTLVTAMEKAVQAGRGGFAIQDMGQEKTLYAGATWEELADNAGLTGVVRQNFLESVRRYNELCRTGRDEDFGKDSKLMIPLEQGPFFLQAMEFKPGFMLVTAGGLLTDERQNVLDQNYEVIPGLYATGNCCGRRFGNQYSTPISGVSIGIAITLGMLAGKAASEQTK